MNAKNKFKIYPSNFRRKYWTKYLELLIYVKKKNYRKVNENAFKF